MLRFKSLAAALLLLGAVNAVTLAADYSDSICLPVGTWKCVTQGQRYCSYYGGPNCSGSCYGCIGSPTLPDKMCFDREGSTCTPVNDVKCAAKLPDGQCVKQDTDCFCRTASTVKGICTFSSCN